MRCLRHGSPATSPCSTLLQLASSIMLKFLSRRSRSKSPADSKPSVGASIDISSDLILRGNALEDDGDIQGAMLLYEQAIQVDPSSWRAHMNLGNVLRSQGRIEEAVREYDAAVNFNPESAGAHVNLATAMLCLGDVPAAEKHYRTATHIKPDWSEPWFGLGCALERSAPPVAAIDAYQKAIKLDPGQGMAAANLTDLLLKQGDSRIARNMLTRVLKTSPDNPFAWLALANLEAQTGHPDQAITTYRRPALIAPDDFPMRSAYLFALNFAERIDAKTVLSEHLQFGRAIAERVQLLPPRKASSPEKRLRIGYVSPDFRRHSVSCFMDPVLSHHDHDAMEIHCYYDHRDRDEITARFTELADRWTDIAGKSDDEVVQIIRDDGIDILVDLTGHTAGNRLPMFARKPAPLQFTWLGYLCTTGLSAIDYRICDPCTDPPGEAESWQVETPARLPHSQWCYKPQVALPAPSTLPMLRNGFCTFGSFNQARKLNESLLRTWAQVLAAIPESRLFILGVADNAQAQDVRDTFAMFGIREHRLDLIPRMSIDEYFSRYRDVDIALDSFPYTGATTTCDALVMGVPVATIAGDRSISRSGASLLSTLGLSDWIADSHEGLIELLKRQLASPEQLAMLRASLPQRMRDSPLMDGVTFTRELEGIFRDAWRRKCAA